MKHIYSYDIECLPNYWSVIFKEYDKDQYETFELYDKVNDLNKLRAFLQRNVSKLISFNGKGYDDILLAFILKNKHVTNLDLYNLSYDIINRDRDLQLWQIPSLKPYTRFPIKYIESVDLMKLHALDKLGISLKQVAVILKHDTIQDFPVDPNEDFDLDLRQELLEYNKNDVDITEKLLNYSLDELKIRRSVSKQYKVDLIDASRTRIGKQILETYYEQYSGIPKKQFKELRTHRPFIDVADIIDKFDYTQPSLIEMYNHISNLTLYPDSKFSYKVKTKYMTHQMGQGGIHSINNAEIYESDEDYIILDYDYGSYYPSLMLKYKITPKHLGNHFLTVLKQLTTQRLEAKKSGDKTTAAALKISINALYGLLGDEKYWLYDLQSQQTVTIGGQLMILYTIDRLEILDDVKCIYSNTDGASFLVKRSQLEKAIDIGKEIEDEVGITLEYDLYDKFILRDVNTFYWIHEDGSVKKKGAFAYKQDVTKGYKFPIIAHALQNYFVNNIPIEDTIYKHTDILDFCASQKSNRKYQIFFTDFKGRVQIQKTNRYFVSNKSGSIVKYDPETKKETSMMANENVYILNNYEKEVNYFKYIDYTYYLRECRKIIRLFETEQLTLF